MFFFGCAGSGWLHAFTRRTKLNPVCNHQSCTVTCLQPSKESSQPVFESTNLAQLEPHTPFPALVILLVPSKARRLFSRLHHHSLSPYPQILVTHQRGAGATASICSLHACSAALSRFTRHLSTRSALSETVAFPHQDSKVSSSRYAIFHTRTFACRVPSFGDHRSDRIPRSNSCLALLHRLGTTLILPLAFLSPCPPSVN